MASTAPIAWEELTRDARKERPATVVAESWNHRSKQEHLAVGAFSMLAHELSDDGCEPIVLSLITRAANDEVRHTEICARMWFALRGEPFVPARFRGTSAVTPADVLLHVVEHCCLSETFTTVAFTEMLARTTHPVAHAVVKSLLADEIDHGRVGWAYLAERARAGRIEGVTEALPEIVVRAVGAAMKPADMNPSDDDPAHERWGYLAPRTIAAIYRAALHDVVLPGFAKFGIDTRDALRALAVKGWA
jgi:hypothetical protein